VPRRASDAKRIKQNRTGFGLGLGIGKLFHASKRTSSSKAKSAKSRRAGAGKRQRVTRTKR